jgi:hypothetical protein
MTDPKFVGPMAQDVAAKFRDRVFEGPDGYLRIRLDDLPQGVSAYDLYRPVYPAGYADAVERWQRVFAHWRKHDSDKETEGRRSVA